MKSTRASSKPIPWFGPLFTNLRLTRTHAPIEINPGDAVSCRSSRSPPTVYGEALNRFEVDAGFGPFRRRSDWDAYRKTVVGAEPRIATGPVASTPPLCRRRRKRGGEAERMRRPNARAVTA